MGEKEVAMRAPAYGIFLLCLAALANGCALSSTPAAESLTQETVYWISMIEAIANPERYDCKRIVLCGFLSIGGPEGEYLYLHQEDYERGISKNGLTVNLSGYPEAKKLNGKYVTIQGTFTAVPRNGRFPYAGSISNVTHVKLFSMR
jgi:hypothetical protein